ncbi:MAG: hypothetical protein KAG61_06700 [Bacteriovoracaceae bacterium]|nr:hypothetical protein [Bacteriovoracaceae bacterium]
MFKNFERTKRPLWVRSFRFFGYGFFLILAPLIFLAGDILSRVVFTDSEVLWYASLLLFLVSATLSLPFAYLLLIHRFKKRYISILHYSVQFFIIGGLLLTDTLMMNFSGVNKFYHHYGNCSTTLGGILQTGVGQSFYSFFLGKFPLPTQYAVESFEDTCRINLIKQDFSGKRPSYCGDTEKPQCLNDLFEQIFTKSPFTPSGIILGTTFRSLLLYKDVSELRKKRKLTVIDHLNFTEKLIDVSTWSLEMIHRNSNVVRIAGDKLARDFNALPNEDKGYYDIVIRNKFLDISDFKMSSALSVVTASPLRLLPDDVDRKLAEYALIQLMDNKVKRDYFKVSSSKTLMVIAKSLEQLEISHQKGDISELDYSRYSKMFLKHKARIKSLL